LHAFHDIERGFRALRLFDRDHAFLSDLLHCVGQELADGLVTVRADGADLSDLLRILGLLGHLLELADNRFDGLIHPTLDLHGIVAGGDKLGSLAIDRLGKYCCGGRAVTCDVRRLGRHLTHHLCAHVLELVLELDFLRNRHAILRDGGGAEALLNHDVTPLGAECHFDGIGQGVHACEDVVACLFGVDDLFGCHS